MDSVRGCWHGPPAGSPHAARPDRTLPLRMQARGRTPTEAHCRRIKRAIWMRALRDRSLWASACKIGLAVCAIEVLCDPALRPAIEVVGVLRVLAVSVAAMTVSILSTTRAYVQIRVARMAYSSN